MHNTTLATLSDKSDSLILFYLAGNIFFLQEELLFEETF